MTEIKRKDIRYTKDYVDDAWNSRQLKHHNVEHWGGRSQRIERRRGAEPAPQAHHSQVGGVADWRG